MRSYTSDSCELRHEGYPTKTQRTQRFFFTVKHAKQLRELCVYYFAYFAVNFIDTLCSLYLCGRFLASQPGFGIHILHLDHQDKIDLASISFVIPAHPANALPGLKSRAATYVYR